MSRHGAGARRAAVATLLAIGVAAPTWGLAQPSVTLVPLGFEVSEMRGPGSRLAAVLSTSDALRGERLSPDQRLVAVWGKGGAAALTLRGRDLRIIPIAGGMDDLAAREAPRGAIPGSRLQAEGPLTVFLAEPTQEYSHGALGDAVEAKSLTILERQPVAIGPDPKPVPTKTARVAAGDRAVFEDLEPRLADLDRDGVPEIVVVRSSAERGASLAVIGRRDATWAIVAETPSIGQPNRWLNPAAIADFDGDRAPDLALVRTPHLEGVLQLWTFSRGALSLKHEAAGYSTHAIGSTALDNAAAVDLDGDGVPELALPTLDRASLAVMSFKGGLRELRRIALPARVLNGVAALGAGRDAHLLTALEDGRLALIRP